MLANRTLEMTVGLLTFALLPLALVIQPAIGIGVFLSFGFLLVPISCIWLLMVGPLLLGSRCCRKSRVAREIIGFLLLPLAVLASCFTVLIPAMGEAENRAWKIMICDTWPFTWEFWRFSSGKLSRDASGAAELAKILQRMERIPLMRRVLFVIRETGNVAELDGDLRWFPD